MEKDEEEFNEHVILIQLSDHAYPRRLKDIESLLPTGKAWVEFWSPGCAWFKCNHEME